MHKFKPFVDSLIENITPLNDPIQHNIILDGGAFNGSYHHGALYYFSELEKKHYIKINKVSGTSIGALYGMFYILDDFDSGIEGYTVFRNTFKTDGNFNFAKKWLSDYKKNMREDSYKLCNGRLFITYYNIKKCKQVIVSKYKNNNHLVKTVLKSISIPFIYDGSLAYKDKYLDGFTPYIFNDKSIDNIYVNLHSSDRIKGMISTYYDKNSYSRILNGIDNAHQYFVKKQGNSLCSNMSQWGFNDKIKLYLKELFYYLLVKTIYVVFITKDFIPEPYLESIINSNFTTIIHKIYLLCINEFLV